MEQKYFKINNKWSVSNEGELQFFNTKEDALSHIENCYGRFVEKEGNKWVVVDQDYDDYKTYHKTKEDAISSIEMSSGLYIERVENN